ncbi:17186_t:CDS:2 [Dentiscutata heterogama]|uniref:17186_t:CDS:1 n=1 Tax=Dentiscutata heterogama TaxID=1316150 RepID=A0ACA9L6B3_9GLOM|nr:17186_t:CDS:2 [Dentiscutata heterogama]
MFVDISTSIPSAPKATSKVTSRVTSKVISKVTSTPTTAFNPSVSVMMPTESSNRTFPTFPTFPIDINLPARLDAIGIAAVAFTVISILVGILIFYKRKKNPKKASNDNNEQNIKRFLGIFTPRYGSFISIVWMIIWMLFSGCVMAFSKYSFSISEFGYYNEYISVVIQYDDVLRWIGISTILVSIALLPGIFMIICKSSSMTVRMLVKIFIFEIFYFIMSNVAFISVYEYAGIKCRENCYNYYNLGIYVERFLAQMYENTYTEFNMPLWTIPLILGTFPSPYLYCCLQSYARELKNNEKGYGKISSLLK